MSATELPDYLVTFDAMRRVGLSFSPSEAQGIAAGLLAGDVPEPERHWADTLYADFAEGDALAGEARALLDRLYRATEAQLADAGFALELWLPGEAVAAEGYDVPEGLRDWVQGFLYGFGLVGEQASRERLSDEGREALHDLYEIGRLAVPEGTLDEEEQQALAELEEYIRVAVMTLHADMHRREPTVEVSHEIH